MKRLWMFGVLLTILGGCAVNQRPMTTGKNLIDIEKDQDQYDVVVLDPGFDTWFATHYSPAKDHSDQYYHNWNVQYVAAWNYKAMNPGYSNYFENVINYDPNTDYGLPVERKLYYYFRFVELQLKIPIINPPRPGDLL